MMLLEMAVGGGDSRSGCVVKTKMKVVRMIIMMMILMMLLVVAVGWLCC